MWEKNELNTIKLIQEELKPLQEDLSKEYDRIIYKAKRQGNTSGVYLYIQMAFMCILILTSFFLKNGNPSTFAYAKASYQQFFETETVKESTFSYHTFMEKMQNEIEIRFDQLVQTFSTFTAKGSTGEYPDNVSTARYQLPISAVTPLQGYISSAYGVRKDPFNSKKKEFHTGLDIAAEKGTFVKAAFDGTVIKAESSAVAGNFITIQSADGISTLYAHNQFLLVKPGDTVLAGQVISTVGATGAATGPHLHFEILIDGVRVNPIYAIDL